MNASTFLSFPPTLVSWILILSAGGRVDLQTIGGDEILVGGAEVRCSAERPVNFHKNGRLVFTYNW